MSSETAAHRNSRGSDKKEQPQPPPPPPGYYQEDAIGYDYYGSDDENGPYQTREEKLERLKQFDKQMENRETCPWRLEAVYPAVERKTANEIGKNLDDFKEHQKHEEENKDESEK